ncbi:MAG: hypothetical protein KA530_02960 [Ferruginibacter sp.]|nr:hypothetical protein [Ferruginibacter sp.]
MSSKGKYIGISNRIPLVVLEYAVSDYIGTGKVNSQDYLKYILEFTKGENRAKKSLSHLTSIITKNGNLLNQLAKHTKGDFQSLSDNDRKAVLICLFALTFPIANEILIAFSVGFKVQEVISKRVILEKMGAMYGSNRSMHIGVDETIPLFLECGILIRQKIGIYAKGINLKITNNFVSELIIYANIKLSGSKSILVDELNFKPWYSYFEISNVANNNFTQLLSKKDSTVGKGYITISV